MYRCVSVRFSAVFALLCICLNGSIILYHSPIYLFLLRYLAQSLPLAVASTKQRADVYVAFASVAFQFPGVFSSVGCAPFLLHHCSLPPFPPFPFLSYPFLSLPFPSFPFSSFPFPSLPFPSLPFPSLPFPSFSFPSLTSPRHSCRWRLSLMALAFQAFFLCRVCCVFSDTNAPPPFPHSPSYFIGDCWMVVCRWLFHKVFILPKELAPDVAFCVKRWARASFF